MVKRASKDVLAGLRRMGRQRHSANRMGNVADHLQSKTLTAIQCDIIGVLAEWAVAAYLNRPMNTDTSGKDSGWDIALKDGRTVDVKAASNIGYRLAVSRDKELKADIYALAYAHPDKPTVYLAGWCTRDEFVAGHHIATEMRNRPRAMHAKQLHRMEELLAQAA